MSTEPNTGLTWQEANSLTTDALHNQVVDLLAVWLNCAVLAVGQAAPTGSEAEGDRYIVGTGTGVFSGHDDELAILRGGTWQFHAPPDAGVPIIKNLDSGDDYEFVSAAWTVKAGGGGGGDAEDVAYDNSTSGLSATNVQEAIDELEAMGGGGGLVLIGSATAGSGGSASLSVGSIPGSYKALWVMVNGRSDAAGIDNQDLCCRFNGDSGANYDCQTFHAYSTGTGFAQTIGSTSGVFGNIPAAMATANRSSTSQFLVPNYANTTFSKQATGTFGNTLGTSTFNVGSGAPSFDWRPGTPAAITSVSVFPNSGNMVEGSTLLVYGLP